MKRLAAIGLVALAAGGAAGAAERPVLAVLQDRPTVEAELARLDARTLKALPGARVPLGRSAGAWSFSPDGSKLAIGAWRALGVRIVDARRLRTVADVGTVNGQIDFLAWLTPRRIVGWEFTGPFALDPVARKIVGSQRIQAQPLDAAAARDAVVALLPAAAGTRTCRLALVRLDGHARVITLERAFCTSRYGEDGTVPDEARERRDAALAVDVAGDRAFVVGARQPVAEIDLRTLRVSYHDVAARATAARMKWLPPGWHRRARWLGDGRIAVGGTDYGEASVVDGLLRQPITPAGVAVIDTVRWESRVLDPEAEGFVFVGTRLLVFGRDGVRALDASGAVAYRVFPGRFVAAVDVAGDTAYARTANELVAFDVRSGAVLRRLGRMYPELLVGRVRGVR